MQFVYKPEGTDPKKWPFAPEKLMSPEAEAIERHTRMTYGDWTQAVGNGSMLALHGLLFVLLKREEPSLKWEEVQFSLSEVDFELDADELAESIANLEAAAADGPLSPNDAALLETLRETQAEAAAAPKD
jgi:hypothetical protein